MIKTEGYENSELFMALTPKNGFKASKLYSYKPIDGTGDFVWNRTHTAYRLNQEGVLELMGNNVPRVNYTNTCPELLIEKASTNLLLRSQEFDNASWVKLDSNIASNSTTAPDNNLTADTLIENTATSLHWIYQEINKSATNITYTASYYIKPLSNNRKILIYVTDSANNIQSGIFNLSTNEFDTAQSVGTGFTFINRGYDNAANGWVRVYMTFTSTNDTILGSSIILADLSNSGSYTGDGTSGVYLWGAQLEQSDYATSYIPTTTTTQTRPQDICYNTANTFGDAAWSVVMRVRLNNLGSNTFEPLLSLNDGTTDVYFCVYTDSNPKLYFDWYNNPDQDTYSTNDLTNGIYNIGVSFDSATADYIIVIDGNLEFSGTLVNNGIGVFANFLRLDLGSIAGTGSSDGDGIIGVQYYNSALTQTDLENLTTA